MAQEYGRERQSGGAWHAGIVETYSVPIVISGVGLLFAIMLGFAPLIGRDAPRSAPATVPAAEAASLPGAGEDRLLALETALASQTQALDSLSNRIKTLEKGITRLNGRAAGQGASVEAMAGMPGRLGAVETQLRTLNVAVPRLNLKLSDQAATVAEVPALAGQIGALEAQMRIVNVAVPRLQARIQSLKQGVGE